MLDAGLAGRRRNVAAAAAFFYLLALAFGLVGRTAVDFVEGLYDIDRVIHEARKVGLEVVVREKMSCLKRVRSWAGRMTERM